MTRRRRLRRRLLRVRALLGLVLLLAAASVLRGWIRMRGHLTEAPQRIRHVPLIRKENTMYGRTSSGVLAAVAALLLAAPASADSQGAGRRATATQQQVATMVGARAEPAWLRALRLRSEALNRQSGLGAWESGASRGTLADEPAWLRALRLRSEALNQYYKLGEAAPGS